jgi:hypothetical protein
MRTRVKEWLWRYAPAELISLPATLLPALLVQRTTGDTVAAALAGTWGGNIGYFGTILLRDVWRSRRRYLREGRKYSLRIFGRNVQALLIEFGLAEVFDSLLVRPALMYYLPKALDSFSWGIILAKFVADLSFYVPAIIFYEWSKKRFRDPDPDLPD